MWHSKQQMQCIFTSLPINISNTELIHTIIIY
jgi:hypothetical protein